MKQLIIGFLPVFLLACKSVTVDNNNVPAHIVAPDDASRSEIQQVVSSALGLKSVVLADDALTKTNVLVIERKNRLGMGIDLGKPNVFRLVKSGSKCVLVFQGTNKRWALRNTRCEAEKPSP